MVAGGLDIPRPDWPKKQKKTCPFRGQLYRTYEGPASESTAEAQEMSLFAQERCQNKDGICAFRYFSFNLKPNGLGASARAVGPAVKRRFDFGCSPKFVWKS